MVNSMRHCFIKFNFFRKIVSIIFSRIANIVDLFLKLVWLNGKLVDFRYSKQAFANVLFFFERITTITKRYFKDWINALLFFACELWEFIIVWKLFDDSGIPIISYIKRIAWNWRKCSFLFLKVSTLTLISLSIVIGLVLWLDRVVRTIALWWWIRAHDYWVEPYINSNQTK